MEREQAVKFIYDLLRALLTKKGSDLFITAGFPPAMKIDSKMTPVSQTALTGQHTAMLVRAVMNDKQAAEFEAKKECNFAINPSGIGRFRINCFNQMGQVGMVMRVITVAIPKFEDLKLPPVLKDGSGRVASHEIMLATSAIKNLIRENKIAQMYSAIQTGQGLGMQTLDQNLTELVKRNVISKEEARAKAANKDSFN